MSAFIRAWRAGDARPAQINGVVRQTVNEEVSKAMPRPRVSIGPLDNTGPHWLIGLGIVLTTGGVTGIATSESWGVITLLIGIIMTIAGIRSRESPVDYVTRMRDTEAKAVASWREAVARTADEVFNQAKRAIHRALSRATGVPNRLEDQFIAESVRNELKLITEWPVDWWSSQSAYPPSPGATTERLSHREYEKYCADWLASLGWLDAAVTRYSKDGGVDVESSEWVVQCKHYDGGFVGVNAVREIRGVASARKKRSCVITSGKFTADARRFAKEAKVALVVLDELTGKAIPQSRRARKLMEGPRIRTAS